MADQPEDTRVGQMTSEHSVTATTSFELLGPRPDQTYSATCACGQFSMTGPYPEIRAAAIAHQEANRA